MVKRGFRFFVFSMFVLAVVLSLGVVSATNATITAIEIQANSTPVYDGGHFTLNWTADAGVASNYTIYLWMNDNIVSVTENANDSEQNYTFTNSTQANYTFTISTITAADNNATNSTNVSMYIDTTAPEMTFTIPVAGWAKGNVLPAVNTTDSLSNITDSPLTFHYGFDNSTGNFSISVGVCTWTGVTASGFNCTATLNVSTLADGNYTFWANVTDVVGNVGYARVGASTAFGVDDTVPTISLSKSSSTQSAIVVDYTSTDSGSGVVNSTLSGSSGTFSGNQLGGLNCGTSYDVTFTSYDGLSNVASSTVSMSTSSCGSSFSGGSSPVTTVRSDYSFDKITPGVASVAKNFASDVGVRDITINVNNVAQNVKVNVIKYDGKPAAVSVEKTGDVYQYLQIGVENIGSKLSNAVVQFRVEKAWTSQMGVDKENVVVSKFDDTSNVWNELETVYSSDDDSYYYYTVELDSFSYFAISEKAVVVDDGDVDSNGDSDSASGEDNNLTWIWILVGVVVLVAIGMNLKNRKK